MTKNPLNIMFGDFTYYNRHTMYSRYTPLAIGNIAQFAKQEFKDDIEVSIFKNAEKFLEKAKEKKPNVVAFSVYYWALDLTKYVAMQCRKIFGDDVTIVLGGPCIDSNKKQQIKFLTKTFPWADVIAVNEGELSFNSIIRRLIAGKKEDAFKEPIDGASFMLDKELIQGKPTGLTIDLSTVGSPYLSGLLDDFMNTDYQPLIQTSRFCPYTCAFCVSGKNRGKLRGYPLEQVNEELIYVAKKFADRPHMTMFLADENFGILKRDVEVAEMIKKCHIDYGFPESLFFYNDKRFTETSRKIIEILGPINHIGLALALQSENPETLKAISRRNVTEDEIKEAILWASKLGIRTTTELIFGMPFETKDSFVKQLDTAVKRGFDSVLAHNLFIMDGIELNRPEKREEFGIKTKFRNLGVEYGKHDGNFFCEHEEVVIETKTLSYQDFLDVRGLNFLFYAVFAFNYQKWFFQFIRNEKISLPDFFEKFLKPNRDENWPKGYLKFLDDFKNAVEGELFDTREQMVSYYKKIYEKNGNEVGDPSRINISFGARLIYLENDWIEEVLMRHLKALLNDINFENNKLIAKKLVSLAQRQRINLRHLSKIDPLNFSFDVINWQKNKFKESLYNFKMPNKDIVFSTNENHKSKIDSFNKRFSKEKDIDFYYEALEFIRPISLTLHDLSYSGK
tara:strand:- start:12042 stop:14078 length:2037 start_codon:yes stop_codon:yes gene_type:complete